MENRSVNNLLCAMVALAYDDYVNGAILLNKSEYEDKNGSIKLISVKGKPIRSYGKRRVWLEETVKNYVTAKMFLEDTRLGEYLLKEADKEILTGKKHRSKIGLGARSSSEEEIFA